MSKSLALEVFASNKRINRVPMHVYSITTTEIAEPHKTIRSAVRWIRNKNNCGVFENGKKIFTTEQINTNITNTKFTLQYEGVEEPDIIEDHRVYEAYIDFLIRNQLAQVKINGKYRKYACKSEISSKWILTENGFRTFTSDNGEITLQRKYGIKVEVRKDGKVYLWTDTGSIYHSNLTVADYMDRGDDVLNFEVKNDWTIAKQVGVITEVGEKTVTDPLGFCKNLKTYYIENNQAYRVEKLADDIPVINVKLRNGGECVYYPQALVPVLTREQVGKIDRVFSNKIDRYVKRPMEERIMLDMDFLNDIGKLSEIGDVSFEKSPCPVELLEYRKGRIDTPKLTCANNHYIACGEEIKVFKYGFYQKPPKKIKIGYLYPRGNKAAMKEVANAIYSFAVKGFFQGHEDKYVMSGLLDIQTTAMIQEEYDIGSILDYKRAANKLAKIDDMDIVIALVPDNEDDDSPYNPFKKTWAQANIPSQMISLSTANLFVKEKSNGIRTKYYLHNIVLGILGKTGGIPWITKDMPGNVDLFVGLDVATVKAGIHYPACSVVFDKYGRLLCFYKPKTPQSGEKIETQILEDIYTEVLLKYEEVYGEKPKNIIIHRDGFNNEDDQWYEKFFAAEGIEYSIIEIRKNISSKLVYIDTDEKKYMNPLIGHCVLNSHKAYLVTTDMKNKKGSPNPLLIEKKCGNAKMTDILQQILFLSQLHVGSTHKMRLPVTTGYADKICKNREFVPEGKIDQKLFFL